MPILQEKNLDISSILLLKGQPIHSSVAVEQIDCWIWLPLAPIGAIYNCWWSWSVEENNCFNFLVNDVNKFQHHELSKLISNL